MKVYFVSPKTEVFQEIDCNVPFEMVHIQRETCSIQGNIEDIIKDKAYRAYKEENRDCFILTEDLVLELDGMNGFPGPYTKEFMKIGEEIIEKVVEVLGRCAKLICVLGLVHRVDSDVKLLCFKGYVDGRIIKRREESKDVPFGLDPIFLPQGYNKTYGELVYSEKVAVSYRSKAVRKLMDYLNETKLIDILDKKMDYGPGQVVL
jgi:non-canonical purine NTP pyrophosphatase (RdgB/HAM1 family)